MRLSEAKVGSTVRVLSRAGGCGLRAHLDAIGIHVGDTLVVLGDGPFRGPVLVEIQGTGAKVAVGRGMAEKIEVEILEQGKGREAQPARGRGHCFRVGRSDEL